MPHTVSQNAARLFASESGNLSALVLKRLEIESHYHHRPDLAGPGQPLALAALEFGRLLNVVYRYGLFEAFREECAWFAAALGARGSGQDAFAQILESWIMAIQGLVKPPECNELADPIQAIRDEPGAGAGAGQTAQRRNALPHPGASALLGALVRGDVPSARNVLARLAAEVPAPERLVVDVMLPAMAEVGRRWESNELEIFQEHLATEVIRSLLTGLAAAAPEPTGRSDEVALVSCAPGDEHELVPLAMTTYLSLRGWNVRNLGTGLPADQIARAVAHFQPQSIFLTGTLLSRLEDALDTIAKIRETSATCRIILGGRGAELGKTILESQSAQVAFDFDEGYRLAKETRANA